MKLISQQRQMKLNENTLRFSLCTVKWLFHRNAIRKLNHGEMQMREAQKNGRLE